MVEQPRLLNLEKAQVLSNSLSEEVKAFLLAQHPSVAIFFTKCLLGVNESIDLLGEEGRTQLGEVSALYDEDKTLLFYAICLQFLQATGRDKLVGLVVNWPQHIQIILQKYVQEFVNFGRVNLTLETETDLAADGIEWEAVLSEMADSAYVPDLGFDSQDGIVAHFLCCLLNLPLEFLTHLT
ncbi:MAG: hypothetical protein GW946_00435 [Candidatus Pacebacteria bacterium]|nr:hypothetical protein [Candidatus Paceibacterota bacterium]PIR60157.1 MAG: hypothetical protein COU67_03150 [Candidatus Pacebacteria bacterium CG10_big_fil_rev_8_21_14_0_10_44_54]